MSLTALSIDVVVALAQRPMGAASSDVARIVEGPGTSVQSSLRLLANHGFVRRDGTRYWLVDDAPGVPEIVALGLRIAQPHDAIRLVLRANDAVELAVVDAGGFVVGERNLTDGRSGALLEAALETIRRDRPDAPPVLRFETAELTRILRSAVGLRTRVAMGDVVKGTVRRVAPVPGKTARGPTSDH